MPTGDNRETLTLKLHPEKDQDLIAWWRSLPSGERNLTVKAALRYALGLPYQPEQPAASPISQELLQIRGEMEELKAVIGQMPRLIRQQSDPEEKAALERRIDQLTEELDRLKRAVATGQLPPAAPAVEAAPQLDPEVLEKRASRLGKGKWG